MSEDYSNSACWCTSPVRTCPKIIVTVCISSPIQDVGQRLMDLNVFMEIQGTIIILDTIREQSIIWSLEVAFVERLF